MNLYSRHLQRTQRARLYHRLFWASLLTVGTFGTCTAGPQPAAGLHLGSQHYPGNGLNNFNPGAFYRSASGWTTGAYYNSLRKPTVYAGRHWDWTLSPSIRAGVTAGLGTGYARPILPFAIPSVAFGDATRLRLSYIPRIEKSGEHVLHASIEWDL